MSKGFLKKYLSEEQLRLIASKIAEVERETDGEIHISIRHRRNWNERRLSLHELTLKEFHLLGMYKTAKHTGVLILFLFNERKFHIIADEGIHAKVAEGTWDKIADTASSHFRQGNFLQGIFAAVDAVGSELQKHFPYTSGDKNEMSNKVDVS